MEKGREDEPLKPTLNKQEKLIQCCFTVRRLMAILMFLGFCNTYGMRVNLSIAIVQMVHGSGDTIEKNRAITGNRSFNWSSADQGKLLSAFFWGYITTIFPSGILSNKYGGKTVFGVGTLSTAIFTLITPAIATHGGLNWLIALRVLQGIGEGVTYPAYLQFWSKWAPEKERAQLTAISTGGCYAGIVVAMLLCGFIAQNFNWEPIFYVYGIFGCSWFILWYFIASNNPESHRFITNTERQFIIQNRGAEEKQVKLRTVPWKKIFTSLPLYGAVSAHFCENWALYTLSTELPIFLSRILNFNIEKSGFVAAAPYSLMFVTLFATGYLADHLRKQQYLSTTTIRKVFNSIQCFGATLFLMLTSYTSNTTAAMVYLTLSLGFCGFTGGGFTPVLLDLSPRYAAILMGISNTVATIPGMIAPALSGLITINDTVEEWRIVFGISGGVISLGGILFFTFASAEVQPWNCNTVEEN